MKKKLILYQINSVANSGSTGRIAEGIARLASKLGFDCYTAFGRWANSSSTMLYKIGNYFSVYLHVFKTRFFDLHGLGSKKATLKLIEHIKQVSPDIIHLHNIHGYYLNYKLLFNFLSTYDRPVVWTLHDCWSFTGHCVHYVDKNCYLWQSCCHDCCNKHDYPSSYFRDSSRYNFNLKKQCFTSVPNLTIVTVSHWLEQQVRGSFLKKYPIITIYNGINPQVFKPLHVDKSKYGWQGKFIILGVASTWNDRKGLSDFISLSKLVADNVLIVLIGLSNKQIKSLPNNIIGLEKTEDVHQLVEFYSLSDLFLNLSTEETFGLTTAESLACGTPVVVYNSSACPEIVTSEVGYVVDAHDIEKIKSIVDELSICGTQSYRDICRSYVLQNFVEDDKYLAYLSLYNSLLNKN